MTERDELVRSLAGLALFADLRDPDLEAIADPEWERRFSEGSASFAAGSRAAGSSSSSTARPPSRSRTASRGACTAGDFFGEVSTLLQCKPTADVVAPRPCTPSRSRDRSSRSSSCSTSDASHYACCRPWPAGSATSSSSGHGRPALSARRLSRRRRRKRTGRPAGRYCLSRLGVEHAVISRDETPGGMFRLYPIFQRLLSLVEARRAGRAGDARLRVVRPQQPPAETSPEHQALVPRASWTGRSCSVARGDGAGLAAFADRVPVPVRYGCPGRRRDETTTDASCSSPRTASTGRGPSSSPSA